MQRRMLLGLIALSLGLLACRKKPFYAPTAELEHGVHLRVENAYTRGDSFYVKTFVSNAGELPLRINRGMWSLRLQDGRLLRAESSRNEVIEIAPGYNERVDVDFETDDDAFEHLTGAALIVGGVMVGTDPTPYVVGEVPLSKQPMALYGDEPPPATPAPQTGPPQTAPPERPPPPGEAVPPPGEAPVEPVQPPEKGAPPPVAPPPPP